MHLPSVARCANDKALCSAITMHNLVHTARCLCHKHSLATVSAVPECMWHCSLWWVQAVPDATGREDLLAALRRALLLRVAAQLGCNKLAIGTCATRMAVRTVAMSAKGQGYALPGALQSTDSRSAQCLPFCHMFTVWQTLADSSQV